MEWSQEEVLHFIDVYKLKPVLWDLKNPHHYDRLKKHIAWSEIADKTGRPIEECKKKFEHLLSTFRREKWKIKRSIELKKDQIYESNWYAFPSLKFIVDKHLAYKTMKVPTEKSVAKINTNQRPAAYEKPPIAHNQIPTSPIILRKRKADDKQFSKTCENGTITNNKAIDDCQHFGNFVAAKLRKFKEDIRTGLQNDIMGLFMKAHRGYYDIQPNCNYRSSELQTSPILSDSDNADAYSPTQEPAKLTIYSSPGSSVLSD